MDERGWIEAIVANSAQLVGAARKAGLDTPVATCPDWTVADLVTHTGTAHRWVHDVISNRAQERRPFPNPEGAGGDPIGWFEEGVGILRDTLEAVDPDEPVWNWSGRTPAPARFWLRRMAHETVIHRVDAESAVPVASQVETELAVDGIDEYLHLTAVRRRWDERIQGLAGQFHFHTTDVEGEWVVEAGPEGIEVRREHAKSPVAVRGPASALELFVYNRGPADDLQVFGDPAMVDDWRDRVRF